MKERLQAESSLTFLALLCHERAVKKGFPQPIGYADPLFLAKLMLVTSELGEIAACVQNADHAAIPEEMADVFIRLFDLCGALEIDIGAEVAAKLDKNLARPYMHGKAI